MENTSSDSPGSEAILWYYAINGQQYGPVPEKDIIALYKSGTIHTRTRLWCSKLANWTALNETELYSKILQTTQDTPEPPAEPVPPPLEPPFAPPGEKKPSQSAYAKEMNDWYNLFWILGVTGMLLLVILVGMIPLVIATVFECFILYRAWKTMPRWPFDVPPLVAVILVFAPVAGTIWGFWLLYFFTKEINKELEKRKISLVLSENYSLVACILSVIISPVSCVGGGGDVNVFVPIFIFIAIIMIPYTIFLIFAIREIKNGAIAIYEDDARNSQQGESQQEDGFLGGAKFNPVR